MGSEYHGPWHEQCLWKILVVVLALNVLCGCALAPMSSRRLGLCSNACVRVVKGRDSSSGPAAVLYTSGT
jgi:hypothetical protein